VTDASGVVWCSDREELYVARFWETGRHTGRRVLPCTFPRDAGTAETLTVNVQANAWAVAVSAFATASVDAQIVSYDLTGFSGSCAGACGGASPGGCFCDDACTAFGDCCGDFADVCVM
jgi:hypothetical protein